MDRWPSRSGPSPPPSRWSVWWVVERGREPHPRDPAGAVRVRELPWRDRRAWSLTLYLTLNSIVFYTALAWLAPSYVDRGWSQADAGFLFGVFTASQIVAALVMPWLAERTPGRRLLYAACLATVLVAILAVGWVPSTLTVLVVAVFGAALGAGFAMGLALLSEYASDGNASTRVSPRWRSPSPTWPHPWGRWSRAPCWTPSTPGRWSTRCSALACVVQFATIPALRRGVRIS